MIYELRRPCLTQGAAVPAFEQSADDFVASGCGISVNSAISALHLARLGLGLGPADRLCSPRTVFLALANCARHFGANDGFDTSTSHISILALAA